MDIFVNALTPMIAGYDNAKLVCSSSTVSPLFPTHMVSSEIPHKLYDNLSCGLACIR